MEKNRASHTRKGWSLDHRHKEDGGRPLFGDKRAPVHFASNEDTNNCYQDGSDGFEKQKTSTIEAKGFEGNFEKNFDNIHEDGSGENRRTTNKHESRDENQIGKYIPPQFGSVVTNGPGHGKRHVPNAYDSSHLDHIFNPPPPDIRREEMLIGRRKRDYLKEHRAAISKMSTSLHENKHDQQTGEENGGEDSRPPPSGERSKAREPKRRGTNFIAKNMEAIKISTPLHEDKPSELQAPDQNENFGKVPPYITKRKNKLVECAEQIRKEEQAKRWPPGLVMMPESERQAVLLSLEQNQAELIYRLQSFPLVVDIPSLVKSKSAVEQKLREVENAIRRFSQSNVYIAAPRNNAMSVHGSRESSAPGSHRSSCEGTLSHSSSRTSSNNSPHKNNSAFSTPPEEPPTY